MLIAASVTMTGRSSAGASMMKAWLIRRSVRNPSACSHYRSHQFVGVETALHQHFSLAFPDQLHRQISGGMAVRSIDDLVTRNAA